jgi:tetratricopeptide (TPR) repeat protein
MAIGLVAIGVVLAARGSVPRRRAVRRRRERRVRMAWRGGLLAVLAVAAVLLGRAAIADSLRATASRSIVANPARAVDKANASLSVNGADVQTYYVKAAALARLGRADEARAALMSALRREPENFVTWALAGDLDVRRHASAQAQAEYRRAAQLDPLDAGSSAGIPADPRAAAQLVGPRPTNVARRPHVVGYQIIKDTSPLELARALGAPGLRASDEVVVGLFGYGVG